MTKSTRDSLGHFLQTWTPERLAQLLQRRPDLLRPNPPQTIAELADRAQRQRSIIAAVDRLNLPENRVVQLLLCGPRLPDLEQLAAMLPEGVSLDDIEPVLAELESWALVWRTDSGHVRLAGAVRETFRSPGGLGPTLGTLLEHESPDSLWMVLRTIRGTIERVEPAIDLPPSAIDGGGPLKSSVLLAELAALLSRPDVVDALLDDAPPGMADLARQLAAGTIELDLPLYGHLPRKYEPSMRPELWLVSRALLLPHRSYATQPREVGLALRGGRPLTELLLDEPTAADGTAPSPEAADATAIERAAHTVRQVGDLLDWFEEGPIACLKDGGLGARSLKLVGARFDLSPLEAGRLVNFAFFAGLLQERRVVSGKGRMATTSHFAQASDAGLRWLELPPAAQWCHLAGSWLRSGTLPSMAGRRDAEDKVVPAMAPYHHGAVRMQRHAVLEVLDALGDGESASIDALTEVVRWRHPSLVTRGPAPPHELVGFVIEEGEQLGVVAHGRLSTYGALLLEGKDNEAAERVATDLPAEADGFTLQADFTLVAVGTLARETALELRLLADEESKGVATSFRISETSIRRAIDAGRTAESILAFLGEHATKGIPQPVEYLVHDVARRHGNIRVGAVASFVRSEDPALLADVLSHKRLKKLNLTALAPTVAVSPIAVPKVIDALRDAGFFPARHAVDPADTDAVVDLGAGEPEASRGQVLAPGEPLPAPFEHVPAGDGPPPMTLRAAEELAQRLLAGAPGDRDAPGEGASGAEPTEPRAADWTSGDHPNELRNLMTKAMGSGHVHSFRLLGVDDPVRVHVESWARGDLVVRQVESGQVIVVSLLDVVAVSDETPEQPIEPMRGVWDRPAR